MIVNYLLIGLVSWVVGFLGFVAVAVLLPANVARDPTTPPRFWVRILGNLIGWPLIVVGVILLPTPANGIILVVVGVVLADVPGKRRLRRRLLSSPRVLRNLNSLRAFFGRPPITSADRFPESTDVFTDQQK